MTKGEFYQIETLTKILNEGCWDENPRPHYEDKIDDDNIILKKGQYIKETETGKILCTPAYTKFINHEVFTYDLSANETPMITLRPIAWKSAVKEILWIYQMQSNKISDLHSLGIKYWDDWNIGDGTIGCRYGETIRKHDLMNKLLDGLVKDPFGRRHIMSMWQEDDFKDETGGTTKGLNPCCYETIWNVRKVNGEIYLDMLLNQRSSDYVTSVCINELQYIALMLMVAKHCGYKVGKFTHVIENVQIYDRHIDNVKEMIKRESVDCNPILVLDTNATNFYDIKFDDFKLVDYKSEEIKDKNPQLYFQLGI